MEEELRKIGSRKKPRTIEELERDGVILLEKDDRGNITDVKLPKKIPKRKMSKEEEEPVKYISFIEHENRIYEQIVGNKFIDSSGNLFDFIEVDGIKHYPNTGLELEKGSEVVLLPTGLMEYGEIEDLIEELKEFINGYYDCPKDVLTYSAWYILLTWVYDRLNTINYLRALGDYGTGKSRWMDSTGRTCYKAIIGSGAGSVASLKRMVRKWKGTVLTDEGDFRNDDEKSDLVKFYNLGFEKNRMIYQCNKEDPDKLDFFNPYCPKIITTRKAFTDQALESRCFTHVAKTTNRKDIPIILPSGFFKKQEELRNKLLKFRFDYYYKIDVDKIFEVELGDNLEPRIKQMSISFASLFANIPSVFEEFKIFLNEYQKDIIESRASGFDGLLVNTIYELIKNDEINITSGRIVEEIQKLDSNFKINVRTVGKHLKSLGLERENKRFDDKRGRVVVFDDILVGVLKKYVPDIELEILEHMEQVEHMERRPVTNFVSIRNNDNKKDSLVLVPHVPNVPDVPFTKFVLKELKTLNETLKPTPFTDLYNEVSHQLNSEDQLEEIISYLKQQNLVLEPKPKMYMVV